MRYDHPVQGALKVDRIAIWNTEKIIVVIAMGIWVADVALHINGKYLLQIMAESLVNSVI